MVRGTWTSSIFSKGSQGSFPNQSTQVLWTYRGHETLSPSVSAVECAQAVWSTLHTSAEPSHMPFVPCQLVPWLSLTPVAINWTFCSDNGWSPPELHFNIFYMQPDCWGGHVGPNSWFTADHCFQIWGRSSELKIGVNKWNGCDYESVSPRTS